MTTPFPRSTLLPLLVGAGTLLWTLNLKSQAQEVPPAPAAPATETAPDAPPAGPAAARDETFSPVTAALLANNWGEAARLLKAMRPNLEPDQISRWELLAARTAIRQGDAKWLAELNADGGLGTTADELLTISGLRLVMSNRLDEAKRMLDSIKDPDAMSEIPRRRYDQLQLKIAQLQNDPVRERKWAGKLVDFVASWDSPTCQSCHANPRLSGKDVTSLDLDTWWVGARYVELLKSSHTAPQVLAAARHDLEADPKDESAKIRLAYALRATGDDAGAQKTLREIPWTAWPDRPFKKPLRLATFP